MCRWEVKKKNPVGSIRYRGSSGFHEPSMKLLVGPSGSFPERFSFGFHAVRLGKFRLTGTTTQTHAGLQKVFGYYPFTLIVLHIRMSKFGPCRRRCRNEPGSMLAIELSFTELIVFDGEKTDVDTWLQYLLTHYVQCRMFCVCTMEWVALQFQEMESSHILRTMYNHPSTNCRGPRGQCWQLQPTTRERTTIIVPPILMFGPWDRTNSWSAFTAERTDGKRRNDADMEPQPRWPRKSRSPGKSLAQWPWRH